jgi:hypothetical protein
MNIAGLSKPAVLAALFNASRQQGMGFMDRRGAQPMTEAEATKVIEARGLYFDYLYGRVMKTGIDGDEIETRLYDRDNGQGAAERAIKPLRATAPA